MAQAIDLSALVSQLGAYCREFKNDIFQDMYLGIDNIEDRMMVDKTLTKERPLMSIQTADIVKPANSATFSPTNNAVKVTPRLLTPRGWKVDLQIDYQELWKTYLYNYDKSGKVPGQNNMIVEFHQYFLAYVGMRVKENLRRALFKGTYNGAGTAVLDIVDGVSKIVADETTAGNLVPVANTNGVGNMANNIAAVHASLGIGFQDQDVVVLLGSTYYRDYIKEVGTGSTKTIVIDGTAGKQQVIADAIQTVDGFPRAIIKHEPYLPANGILITPKNNMIVGFDPQAPDQNIDIQKDNRLINVLIDGSIGFNFHQTKFQNANEKPIAINDKW